MSERIERHGRISVTRHSSEEANQTQVHVAQVAITETRVENGSFSQSVTQTTVSQRVTTDGPGTAVVSATHETRIAVGNETDVFDPECSCDARERALIASLRAYLRPASAPQCLISRLTATLDRCCLSENPHRQQQ